MRRSRGSAAFEPMNRQTALEAILRSYEHYYNINRDTPAPPFAAEATFRLHDERYFLVKKAVLSEADANEYVYFASVETLTPELFAELDAAAWDTGLARVEPNEHHRCSDVSLVILADRIEDGCRELIRKTRRTKSYAFGFRGYSHYRLIACDLSTGALLRNRMGEPMEKTIRNIIRMS